MTQRELKVFEGRSPQEIEYQVNEHAEKEGVLPFSVSSVYVREARKAFRYKAFVVFEGRDVHLSDIGRRSN